MVKPRLWLLLIGWILGAFPAIASAELKTLETEDLRLLYFHPTQTFLAPHAARCFENSIQRQKSVFDYEPSSQVTTLMTDFSDYGNAAANALPRNSLFVDIAPLPFTFETAAPAERLFTIMNHELVHVATTDQAAPEDLRYRALFQGKVAANSNHPLTILYQYLTVPRKTSPRWYLEGIATFMETWMAGGLGRAQGAYDEMVFRSMVRDDAHFYDPLGLVAEGTKVDFQVGANAYLYGTRFMSYMALKHSPEKLIAWVQRLEGSRRHYSAQFRHVYGMDLEDAWQDWIDWEHEFQEKNLATIREYPITPREDLSSRALGSVSRSYFDPDTGKIYAGIRYPGVVAHIGGISVEDGSVERLQDIIGPMVYRVTSFTYDRQTKTVFYTNDNYEFRDVMSLDVETGEVRRLFKDLRVGELVFNRADRSIWGVRHLNGIATLVRIPYPYEEWEQIHSFPYGEVLYDLDISPDGRLLSTSFGELDGDQSLRLFEIESLMQGEVAPVRNVDFGQAVPESFTFTADGRYLYGSSYITGVSNIFRYEPEADELEAISNTDGGFFRPMPMDDGSLIVFRYTGEGFVPTQIDPRVIEDANAITFLGTLVAEEHPIVRTWQVGSPADVPLDQLITEESEYKPWENTELEAIYPVVEGYKSSIGAGLHTQFSDHIGFNRLGVTASITPNQARSEQGHVYVKHQYQRLDELLPGSWTTELKYNYADFYDIFGPTKVSKKGYSGEVTYERPIIFDGPREMDLTVKGGYWGNLDEVPYAQDVDATFDSLANAQARLDYSYLRKSLGAVDDEKGYKWSAVGGGNYADSKVTPYMFGKFDYGWALPLHHYSIWLRNAAGFAVGDKDDEFANYYFGGFRNNYVDNRDPKRYREPFSLPGFSIDDLNGRTFTRSMLEWNIPPVRFRRMGVPDFYFSWARPAIFAAALVTNPEDDSDTYYSIGAQIDFEFTVLSRLPMMFSIGYAAGYDDGDFEKDDIMASLKIL
jgi:hypothetical protein